MLNFNPKQKIKLQKVLVSDLKLLTKYMIDLYKEKLAEVSKRGLFFDKKMELLCELEILFKLIEKLSKVLAFEQKREKKVSVSIPEAYWMYQVLDDLNEESFSNFINPTALHMQLHQKLSSCI